MSFQSIAGSLTLLTIALATCSSRVSAAEFREIYNAAIKLEKTGNGVSTMSEDGFLPDVTDEERRTIKIFLKPAKGELIGKRNLDIEAMIKAIDSSSVYIYHSMKKDIFLGGLFRTFMLNKMRDYAKDDSQIGAYVDLLRKKVEDKSLNSQDIECAMDDLKLRHQQIAMSVLFIDLKNLILNEIGVVIDAIISDLNDAKFNTNIDRKSFRALTDDQRNALTEFYTTYRDPQSVKTHDLVDHVLKPSVLITGRIIDSCSKVNEIYEEWKRTLIRNTTCSGNMKVFDTGIMPDDKIELIHSFCSRMAAF